MIYTSANGDSLNYNVKEAIAMKFNPIVSLFAHDYLEPEPFFNWPLIDSSPNKMKTDIIKKEDHLLINMELPGYDKSGIHFKLNDDTLTVSANCSSTNEEKDEKGKVIRQERFLGSCSRSFYVGKGLNESDIKTKFENGELKIMVSIIQKQVENKKMILIE